MTSRVSELIHENRSRTIAAAWDSVLDTAEGRLVVWSILEECLLFQQTHHGNDLDGWRAGMREIGLRILQGRVFAHDVRTFGGMQTEHALLMERIKSQAEMEAQEDHANG